MKTKLISLSFIIVVALYPSVTFASWWNPFTWKIFQHVEQKATTTPSEINTASSTPVYTPPPADELLKRIAELEDKLDKARLQKEEVTAKIQNVVATTTAPVVSGLTTDQIMSKVKPAIVQVQTATSSGSGTIIDPSGYILTNAHTVWAMDPSGAVVGAADSVTIMLSNGTKKTASLIGLDEANDIAILLISGGGTFPYLKLNYDSGIKVGDKAYVFSTPSLNGGGTGGYGFVGGVITKKGTNSIEMNTDSKPLDTGGAIVTANANFIGIPNKSNCKVLEEMTNCLKYTITTNIVRDVLPKVLQGMRLYKNKKNSTTEETLIHERLQWMYGNTKDDGSLEYTINGASGDNSFDFFNNRLDEDQDGKITKLYLFKLKQIAANINSSMESLSSRAHELDVFFIDESASIDLLGNYEKKILRQIQSDNATKLKEYQAKVTIWSRKKNEYDTHIASPAGVTHDYLMNEGVVVEKEIDYLKAERTRIMNTFSGEAVNIF